MNVVYSGLEPNGPDAWHSQNLSSLFVSDVATINSAAIELRKAVAINRVVEKKREIRE